MKKENVWARLERKTKLTLEREAECLQCGKKDDINTNLNIIEEGTYTGCFICDKCLEENESHLSWDDFN